MKYILTLLILLSLELKGQTIVVAKDGTGDFTSIQKAIESYKPEANKYKTILIKNGTYNEKLYIDVARHHLRLKGETREGVIIEFTQARDIWRCENPNDYGAATINVMASDVVFENLTVINDYGFKAKGDTSIVCLNEAGKVNLSTVQNYALPREQGEKEGEKIVRKDGHQFALRSMPGATRLSFISCTFRSGGGDTVSPWDVDGGMYYFKNCEIEGHVDLYCPRGNALIEDSKFICHNMSAAIWHDGSSKESDKTVLVNCTFEGDEGFKLGRYHREAQMFLLDCKFSKKMADAEIYQSGDRKLQWGHRIYYKNCHRDGGDFAWFGNNTHLKKKDLSFKKVFGNNWSKPNLD
ncbi:pectinesterase [Lacihabitans sp. LS3-19]|uniref:pectinesterase family protein n=1 Tax=Lacihabitans sp. LS3-19 TaxID=2487335 RepID=UPI0020CDE47D|nr:pectinesterase family protein [Lacihabitans sp. LS3-19]MCP9770223.1 pectinesterase [Lacihabitans sp. LS3-19]